MAIRKSTKYFVIHVTATRPSTPAGVAEVTKMHKDRGFSTIGYHYVIRRNGKVEIGRPENQVGAHVQGWNSVSLGIALEGGLDEFSGKPADTRTPAQTEALIDLIQSLRVKYPEATVCGHRDLSPDRDGDGVIEPFEYLKECPCFDAIPWAAQNALPAANIRGSWLQQHNPTPPDSKAVENQKLLKRAGYEFGALDGLIGPKTRAAIARFQTSAKLPVTKEFDPATVQRLRNIVVAPIQAALEKDDTLKIIPPPAPVGIGDLRALGSRTIQTADAGILVGALTGLTGVIETARNTVDMVRSAKATLDVAYDLVLSPSSGLVLAGLIALYLFRQFQKIRVEEHNAGTNIGLRPAVEFLHLKDTDLKL